MAERFIALSIDKLFDGNHNHPKIAEFIDGFTHTIHSGDGGRIPAASVEFNVDAAFPLRVLVGVPKKLLTREQKILTEAYCSYFFKLPLRDQPDVWQSRHGWKPVNHKRSVALLNQSDLDTEWINSLGISRFVFEKFILITPNALSNKRTSSSIIRHLLALSVFGFADPYQFFTEIKQ